MTEINALWFDLDGVLARYDGWKGWKHIGEPNLEVIGTIQHFHNLDFKIILFSTRSAAQMKEWCEKHDISGLIDYYNINPDVITGNTGKPAAALGIDDRVLTYRGQTTKQLVEQIQCFQPWSSPKIEESE